MRVARLLAPLALLLLGDALGAQGTIRGVVTDSLITRAPMQGATVILQGAPHTAVTDRLGRFVMRDVPPGSYTIGFFHPALDSLEASAPVQRIVVREAATTNVALGTPAANSLSQALCGRDLERASSVVFGVVRDAEAAGPLPGAVVRATWFVWQLVRGAAQESQRVESDTVDADGRYVLCSVPNDIALTLTASTEDRMTGELTLALDHLDVGRRDLMVSRTDTAARIPPPFSSADTTPWRRPTGRSRLRVLVRTPQGRPVEGATVGIRGTSVNGTTDASGSVRLVGIPSGSQTLLVRRPGSEPATRIVALRPGEENAMELEIGRGVTVLPTVAVTGQRTNQLERDIQRRRMLGFGKFYDAKALEKATLGLGFWAQVPGIRLMNDGMDVMPLLRNSLNEPCLPNVWIDGGLLYNVAAWELHVYIRGARWMEVYPSSANRPPEFTSSGDCGAIVIWTH